MWEECSYVAEEWRMGVAISFNVYVLFCVKYVGVMVVKIKGI